MGIFRRVSDLKLGFDDLGFPKVSRTCVNQRIFKAVGLNSWAMLDERVQRNTVRATCDILRNGHD
ncbi:MAG: hypothetical protein VR71_01855 [Roseovarius sp. BRH_c41]|nr:MAG: hypothetical protein VR71_01855 [Roseovarius sp. BRH_c41]